MFFKHCLAGVAVATAALLGVPWQTAQAQWLDTGLIVNGSFEADTPYQASEVGYVSTLTGWAPSGNNAILNDASGPFYNAAANGPIPQGAQVAGMQGEGTLSQTLNGLEDGEAYRLTFYVNTRNCCPGDNPAVMSLRVNMGTETVHEITPVQLTANFQFVQVDFEFDEAWGETLELEFFAPTGDATIMVDAFFLLRSLGGDGGFPPVPDGAPIAGPLGLAALLSGVAAGGAMMLRRRRKN